MGIRRARHGDHRIAVAYLRCSTSEQELGPEAQLAAVASWASRNGVHLAAVHSDLGVSGARPVAERAGLCAALAALRSAGAGVLVASKRDRFARDVAVVLELEKRVELAGAVLRTADGSSDARGASGSLQRGVSDLFASYERDLIRDRTREALAVKRSRGERMGCLAYGTRVAADGLHVEDDPREQQIVELARAFLSSGLSQSKVAKRLNAAGCRNRAGGLFRQTQVSRMLFKTSRNATTL